MRVIMHCASVIQEIIQEMSWLRNVLPKVNIARVCVTRCTSGEDAFIKLAQ